MSRFGVHFVPTKAAGVRFSTLQAIKHGSEGEGSAKNGGKRRENAVWPSATLSGG
jgi:hypothetical protein